MGFKNSGYNFTEIDAAGTSRMLPAGGYVAIIKDVEDVEKSEYLRFTYDIAEGEYQHFFADDDRAYTHQFVRSYKEKAVGFMKQFLKCVEDSGGGFKLDGWDNDPEDLVGQIVGILVQREDYTNKDGEDRARMNVDGFASAGDIRKGRYKLPEPRDTRKKAEAPKASGDAGAVYDADLPF